MKFHDIFHATPYEYMIIAIAFILDVILVIYFITHGKKINDADNRQASKAEIDELMDEENWLQHGESPNYYRDDHNYN